MPALLAQVEVMVSGGRAQGETKQGEAETWGMGGKVGEGGGKGLTVWDGLVSPCLGL